MDISAIPIKDWMPTIITAVVTLIVAVITLRNKRQAEFRGRADKAHDQDLSQSISQAQDLTARFRTLMEGYENRIKDLTTELAMRKMENERWEKLYEDRQVLCNDCPTYLEHLRTRDGRPSPSA